MDEVRKIKVVYLSDIAKRLKNSRKILLSMERGNIIKENQNSFETSNAVYIFVNCVRPERVKGIIADQVIIDLREPMRSMAKNILRESCVPKRFQVIDDREIGTSE